MQKGLMLTILLLVFFLTLSFAETIQLKSGQKAEGKILEEIENYLVVKLNDGKVETYMIEDIDTIDGKEIKLFLVEQKTKEAASVKNQKVEPANPPVNKLPFSTVIITYKYKGSHRGKEIVYIDAVNNKAAQEIETTGHLFGQSLCKREMNIYDGNNFYHIDLGDKGGVKGEQKGSAISVIFGSEQRYADNYSGERPFLGKVCKIYKPTAGILYFWNGIILKEEVTNHPMGKDFNYTKEAVDIRLDVEIPADKFRVPPGIKLLTGEEMIGEMKKMFKKIKSKCKK